ncbi:gamma-glutamyltransferase [Absidia repens]|uniref:Gamma-glutamyltransferase n=1 Tax=Absidia repens TaxID=90262 RepID=A0A1X2J1B2_9FUNG|nr:gamma-glutamyltransferase [Absidia repens]
MRSLVIGGAFLLLCVSWLGLTTNTTKTTFGTREVKSSNTARSTANASRQPSFQGHLVSGTHGAVAVETQECSDVGVEILRQGGNAVDSAIASALCIGVMSNFATVLTLYFYLRGGFMLIRSPNGEYEFIDYRETAPQGSDKDMYRDDPLLAQRGGLAIGVPGEIRGFELAHKRHGVLPWAKLFSPAIKIAREGFTANDYLYEKLMRAESWLLEDDEFSKIYAPTGTLAKPGDIIKRPTLANTLEIIAQEGPDAFYTGHIAESIIETVQAAGGIMTLDDLRGYEPIIRPTISTYYHGKKITTCTAPTSGPILLSILNILEQYPLHALGRIGVNVHRLVESMKFGFAFRTEFGDPEFTHLEDRYQEITTKQWADKARANISDTETHSPLYYQPKYDHIDAHGTMHLTVVDENDGVVTLTSTVNLLFGSRVMDPVTGIILNDEMDDFSIPGIPNDFGLYPAVYNYVEPGKRPLSSITPTIVESDGNFDLALGGSGGSQIITATLNVSEIYRLMCLSNKKISLINILL